MHIFRFLWLFQKSILFQNISSAYTLKSDQKEDAGTSFFIDITTVAPNLGPYLQQMNSEMLGMMYDLGGNIWRDLAARIDYNAAGLANNLDTQMQRSRQEYLINEQQQSG